MKRIWSIAIVAASTALAGCGDGSDNGGVTAEESRELDNAAEMLDASPDSLVADDEAPLGNGDEPAAVAEDNGVILNDGSLPPAQ